MKRYINTFLISFAFLTVLVTHNIVRAQQTVETAQKEATKSVDYVLPYPGILPDSPFYKIKMIRDRIISWFIFDPVKKAEYFLLMADKRINAGKMLIEYGKVALGESTISKGQAYMVKAMEQTEKAKAAGKNIDALIEKLDKATAKHLEVLQGVLEKVPEQAKKGIQNAILNSQKGHENVLRIMERKRERLKEKLEEKEKKSQEQNKIREEEELGKEQGETVREREREEKMEQGVSQPIEPTGRPTGGSKKGKNTK